MRESPGLSFATYTFHSKTSRQLYHVAFLAVAVSRTCLIFNIASSLDNNVTGTVYNAKTLCAFHHPNRDLTEQPATQDSVKAQYNATNVVEGEVTNLAAKPQSNTYLSTYPNQTRTLIVICHVHHHKQAWRGLTMSEVTLIQRHPSQDTQDKHAVCRKH